MDLLVHGPDYKLEDWRKSLHVLHKPHPRASETWLVLEDAAANAGDHNGGRPSKRCLLQKAVLGCGVLLKPQTKLGPDVCCFPASTSHLGSFPSAPTITLQANNYQVHLLASAWIFLIIRKSTPA